MTTPERAPTPRIARLVNGIGSWVVFQGCVLFMGALVLIPFDTLPRFILGDSTAYVELLAKLAVMVLGFEACLHGRTLKSDPDQGQGFAARFSAAGFGVAVVVVSCLCLSDYDHLRLVLVSSVAYGAINLVVTLFFLSSPVRTYCETKSIEYARIQRSDGKTLMQDGEKPSKYSESSLMVRCFAGYCLIEGFLLTYCAMSTLSEPREAAFRSLSAVAAGLVFVCARGLLINAALWVTISIVVGLMISGLAIVSVDVALDAGTLWSDGRIMAAAAIALINIFVALSFLLTASTTHYIARGSMDHKIHGQRSRVTTLGISVFGLIAGASVLYAIGTMYISWKEQKADRAAGADVVKLSAGIERLYNELAELGCDRWTITDEHVKFARGPYYGWRGTTKKAGVRVRIVEDELQGCALKGTKPAGSDTRYIYRVSLKDLKSLPPTVAPCTGNAYEDATCFTESMVSASGCIYRFASKQPDPERVRECEELQAKEANSANSRKDLAVEIINPFSVDAYHRLKRADENLFFSGYGAFSVKLALLKGARGETRDQIIRIMRIAEMGDAVQSTMDSLLQHMTCAAVKGAGTLSIENRIIFENANVFLRNEILFKNQWEHAFEKSSTTEWPFFLMDGKQVSAPLMFQESSELYYTEAAGMQVLEMPYLGKELSMVVFLPREKDGLPEFEKNLKIEDLTRWLSKLEKWELGIKVHMPRFHLSANHDLVPLFTGMGMTLIFSSKADFSGFNVPRGGCVTDSAQNADIEVDELGTVAHVFSCDMITGSAGDEPPVREEKTFRADHPFMFLVRHIPSGCILFMGRMTNPVEY